MAFLDDLLPLMPHTLTATPVALDAYGTPTPTGTPLSIPCQVEGVSRIVRDAQGREVVSSFTVYCGQLNNLTVDGHVFTVPGGFGPPGTNIKAIRVDPVSDEAGRLYEVVMLP